MKEQGITVKIKRSSVTNGTIVFDSDAGRDTQLRPEMRQWRQAVKKSRGRRYPPGHVEVSPLYNIMATGPSKRSTSSNRPSYEAPSGQSGE